MTTTRRSALLALLLALTLAVPACTAAPASPDVPPARADAPPVDLTPGTRTVTVDADQVLAAYYRFWMVANYNNPHTLLDPSGLKGMLEAAPMVKEINCVYLLGGRWEGENEWCLGVNDDGSLRTDFTGLIAQLKAALDAGFTPHIVLDNVPAILCDPPIASFYGNTAPPKDERLWHKYVKAAVEAMVRAFGRDKVAAWTFRVGTEPDLYPGHWAGTKEQYLAHYDFTVDAVRSVLPEARVGPGNILNPGGRPRNPRPARPGQGPPRVKWGLDIIDHAAVGTNACTGRVGAPMDFFTCSWYTRVGQPTSSFDGAMATMRERLGKYEQFKNTPIEIGEFAVLGDERGRRLYAGDTTEWSASFFAALADRVYALDIKQLYEWDHATRGVLHPRGRVIQMLEQLVGGRRLGVTVQAASQAECGALACRQGDDLLLVVYNHRPQRRPQVSETVHLVIRDRRMASSAAWRMSEWTIDQQRASWAYAYEADCQAAGVTMLKDAALYEGNPVRLYGQPGMEIFKKNAAKYAALSVVPVTQDNVPVAVGSGSLKLDLDLTGHSVRLIRLSPPKP